VRSGQQHGEHLGPFGRRPRLERGQRLVEQPLEIVAGVEQVVDHCAGGYASAA